MDTAFHQLSLLTVERSSLGMWTSSKCCVDPFETTALTGRVHFGANMYGKRTKQDFASAVQVRQMLLGLRQHLEQPSVRRCSCRLPSSCPCRFRMYL